MPDVSEGAVMQALAGRPITVFGDGSQSRCFTDVSDVVGALIGLAEHPEAVGEVFNIGSGQEVTILELAQKVKELTGSQSEVVFVPYDKAYEEGFEDMQRRVPDISKVQKLIGYEPNFTLEQTLERVIDFFSKA